jgi:hypothetical protein
VSVHRYIVECGSRQFVVYGTDPVDALRRIDCPEHDGHRLEQDDEWALYPAGQCEDRRGAPGA